MRANKVTINGNLHLLPLHIKIMREFRGNPDDPKGWIWVDPVNKRIASSEFRTRDEAKCGYLTELWLSKVTGIQPGKES